MSSPPVKVARLISVIGHPFLLMPLLTGIVAFHLLPPKDAWMVELTALGVVILPASVYTVVRVQRGTWGDLDVSNQHERNQFYAILLPLLLIIAVISWIADVPRTIPLGALSIIALVGAAFFFNTWMKLSLHTGFAVFAAETFFLFRPTLGGAVLLLAVLVGWSRTALGRHTVTEVFLGGALGAIVGATFALGVRYLT